MMADVITKLSYEAWDSVFDGTHTDLKFHCSLNIYLRIYYSSFPLIRVKGGTKNKTWVTIEIKAPGKHKTYLASRKSAQNV
jgi:hypothetical protein